ncbi:MAG: alkaline phosphatase [Desulfobacteraceae bacterium]|jgi:alkaline phosphatase|nr:alkaline phosphatase [Desulfobacteraceae bacterium]
MNFKRYLKSMMVAVVLLFLATTACANQPKYVFFFLGDGMASAQIQATEAYLATKYAVENGWPAGPYAGELDAEYLLNPANRLNMSKMPIAGMQTTYDSYALQTDSASSATAFACGQKTRSGVIGMDDAKTVNFKSVAQFAHEQGKKVGILSSVSLDHATPAAYYASVASRDFMNNIATQLADTGYEFFGGGGFAWPTGPKKDGDTSNNVWDLLTDNGYEVRNTRDAIMDLKDNPRDKVVCINPTLAGSAAMPYAIDQPPENLSLAEMTEVAIATLYDGRRGRGRGRGGNEGFFIMVEGGKIDWACHANDAMATIGDMIDFDNAIGVALEFMRRHPLQTLIVVTGDHETGGMTIGHATTGYKAYYDKLLGQTKSYENFEATDWAAHKAATAGSVCGSHLVTDNLASDATMLGLMEDLFGLVWTDLNDYQKEKLEDAYDKSMCGSNDNSSDENNLLYGYYNPIIVTITHILNERASVGWTSYSHTGVPVPVFAQGREAVRFAGFYDNTDIAKKLARVLDVREDLPVEK